MISNWKSPFGCDVFFTNQGFQGLILKRYAQTCWTCCLPWLRFDSFLAAGMPAFVLSYDCWDDLRNEKTSVAPSPRAIYLVTGGLKRTKNTGVDPPHSHWSRATTQGEWVGGGKLPSCQSRMRESEAKKGTRIQSRLHPLTPAGWYFCLSCWSRLLSLLICLLVDQITVIGNEMSI